MQNSLFPDHEPARAIAPARPDAGLVELAAMLPRQLYLGTSSWHYPGWAGLVWDREYPETALSRHGLAAYSQHPLFRTVGIDRGFYRPLEVAQYAAYAAQVPEDFRFVVKAPGSVTDALVRDGSGRGRQVNACFLDAGAALRDFVEPVLTGLGSRAGALVFQISPLPVPWLAQMPRLIERLHLLLRSLPAARDAVVAVEVRDGEWLTPEFIAVLRDTGATYCMGLHARMPRVTGQLPVLRALWPGPLVCRWSLNPLHGAFGYEDAQATYQPYDRMLDPDPETRATLAKVIIGTVSRGYPAYVTLSNKAEGSAPLSVAALARSVGALAG